MIQRSTSSITFRLRFLSRRTRKLTPAGLAEPTEIPVEKIRGILKIPKQPVSLETRVGEDADAALGDMIEVPMAASPPDAVVHANMSAAIGDALSPREAKICCACALGSTPCRTTRSKNSASSSTLTRGCIHPIESEAMRKLMHPSNADKPQAISRPMRRLHRLVIVEVAIDIAARAPGRLDVRK